MAETTPARTPSTPLEAVRMLQAIEARNDGEFITLQQIAQEHPEHVTAALLQAFTGFDTMLGAARLALQQAAGIAPTDDKVGEP